MLVCFTHPTKRWIGVIAMRDRRLGLARTGVLMLWAAMATVVGAAMAQQQNAAPKGDARADAKSKRGNNIPAPKGAARAPAQAPKAQPGVADPFAPDTQAKAGAM